MRDDDIINPLLRELDELRRKIDEAIEDSMERIRALSRMNSGDNTSNDELKDLINEAGGTDQIDVDSTDVLSGFLRPTPS